MRILLAIDDSNYSRVAAEAVASRPWPPGTQVRVLSVVNFILLPITDPLMAASGMEYAERTRLQQMSLAEQLTENVAESLRVSGLTAETAVLNGDPRSTIVDEAVDWKADLIVVGSHGYTGIKRLLLGSVAQSVISHAPCSVEVVREKIKVTN
jgi:nucleotide-binding universal stress UspA family protein